MSPATPASNGLNIGWFRQWAVNGASSVPEDHLTGVFDLESPKCFEHIPITKRSQECHLIANAILKT